MPTTPVDAPISGLPPNPGVAATDLIETVDVSNTSNNPTGENTRSTVAGLVAGLPVMGASGAGHAAGLVGDPGPTPGTSKFWREDATFAVPAGGGGGSGTPGGGTGDIQVNNAGAFGGLPIVGLAQGGTGQATAPLALNALLPSQAGAASLVLGSDGTNAGWVAQTTGGGGGLTSVADKSIIANVSGAAAVPVANTHPAILDAIYGTVRGTIGFFRGATLWQGLAPAPAAGFNLQSGGPGADPAWGAGTTPLFTITGSGNQVVTAGPASLLQSPITITGSLTIPPNRLQAGSSIGGYLWGDFVADGAVAVTISISVGGALMLTGVSGTIASTLSSSRQWRIQPIFLGVQSAGAGGTMRGDGSVNGYLTSNTPAFSINLTGAGGGNVGGPVALNTTIANAIDITVTGCNANNKFRLGGGVFWVVG